ncbi:hypothetical protein [Ciceribacter sp. RN22]|uniref:hypothetical protein n=1 Tax=Ciceribacter sp. RN22 TaxID=2954932 RepID=UPI0020939FAC|nr:hypothetical protein [Ciceribacter sp. RN22]MCO6179435.1 hypothetical protein [Ciceribacter sp. RN22]
MENSPDMIFSSTIESHRSLSRAATVAAHSVSARFGAGDRQAVLLSPILPQWDGGAYFQPLIRQLAAAGFEVTVFDTLSLLVDSTMTFGDLATVWAERLAAVPRIDLIGGAALGGSIVQSILLCDGIAQIPDAILVSAPTVTDPALNEKLLDMARLAREVGAAAALRKLALLVTAETKAAEIPDKDAFVALETPQVRSRLTNGFTMLAGIDLRPQVGAFGGRLLHLYGRDSRLVRSSNIAVAHHDGHAMVGFEDCGMRPLGDFPDRAAQEIAVHFDLLVP